MTARQAACGCGGSLRSVRARRRRERWRRRRAAAGSAGAFCSTGCNNTCTERARDCRRGDGMWLGKRGGACQRASEPVSDCCHSLLLCEPSCRRSASLRGRDRRRRGACALAAGRELRRPDEGPHSRSSTAALSTLLSRPGAAAGTTPRRVLASGKPTSMGLTPPLPTHHPFKLAAVFLAYTLAT